MKIFLSRHKRDGWSATGSRRKVGIFFSPFLFWPFAIFPIFVFAICCSAFINFFSLTIFCFGFINICFNIFFSILLFFHKVFFFLFIVTIFCSIFFSCFLFSIEHFFLNVFNIINKKHLYRFPLFSSFLL